MKIIVNIPAYNEEEKIVGVIKAIPRNIKGHEVQVMVVDDGSTDRTVDVSKNAGAEYVISHEYNKGVGGAFKTGVENFWKLQGDILVNIDADGQFSPEDIPRLLDPVLKYEADIVLASRFSGKKAQGIPFIKKFLNKVIAFFVSKLMRYKIDDLTCWFRVYSKESLYRLNLIETFTYTQEVIIDAIGKDLRLKWISVDVKYFVDRKSRVVKSITSYMSKSLMIILRTVRDVKPLIFFGFPGVLLFLTGLFLFLVFLFFYLQEFQTTPYRTWLIVSFSSMGMGILLFIFASIADMIK